jgi:proteasome lid subunit RPN8/RPN11
MLTPKIKMSIFAHAGEEFPKECCGVVTQRGKNQTYHKIKNVHPKPEEHFELDAQQYADIMDSETIIAIVHSHCGDGCTARPSAADTCSMNEVEIPYVIVSLPEGDMSINYPNTQPLTGRPWALGSYDCWGLIMAFHKEYGIALRDYREGFEWWKPEHGLNIYDDNWIAEGFELINGEPEFGDMIMMQIQSPVTNHAGIYLGDNQILHHFCNRLSKIDIYSGYWRDNTVRIVRHKKLDEELNKCKIHL